ncbi:transmembrane protein 160 [Latimeria chalumnae]|uniref:transmembrane protein 160 n=1 Tax=Latimeria chalumnae TaxID=7897 RepID=UPI00313EBFCE
MAGGWWYRPLCRGRYLSQLLGVIVRRPETSRGFQTTSKSSISSRGNRLGNQFGGGKGVSSSGYPQQQIITELDKADAWMVRKAHETGFLSWFRNGLVATGIGVISYAQSDVGQEAAFGFFVLGGICVSYGSASYLANLVLLRRTMMLSFPVVFMNGLAVASVAVFWLCAISLYIGRLKVEVVYDEEECDECKAKKNDGKSDK